MAAESHIETRTAEQMLADGYRHCIECGDYYLKLYGWKHDYLPMNLRTYLFNFDKKSTYHFHGKSKDGFFFYFRRNSDFAALTMTKYSVPPEEVFE